MTTGETVAIKDPESGRWRAAEVISVSPLRAVVASASWWAIVPRDPDHVRPLRMVRA